MKSRLFVTVSIFLWSLNAAAATDAFEAGPGREADLPGGKEADGIRGDFVLRNDKIVALVSHNAPLRRANMSTFYGADGVTPGCLYDLTLRDAPNDQLIYFGPAGQRGEVSWVRAVPGGKAGEASVETVVTAAKNGGIFKRHEYRVRQGESGIWIITTLRNETAEKQKVVTKDEWTRFNETGEAGGIRWADAVDPADGCGYAVARVPLKDLKGAQALEGDSLELNPGQGVTWSRFLAVGHSPLEAWGEVNRLRAQTPGRALGVVSGIVTDEDGRALDGIWVAWAPGNAADPSTTKPAVPPVPCYTRNGGQFHFSLPQGDQQIVVRDLGRPEEKRTVKVTGAGTQSSIRMRNATRLRFSITREDGSPIPCKAQILATGETKPVDLGPVMRAHGCKDQYHSADGRFAVQVPPGTYHVVVTHGIEFSHHARDVAPAQGEEMEIKAVLKRLVDTAGWISTDFHNHSTPSGDNICGTPDRIINLAAEHIEFAPGTEHNRIFDWRPTIEKLGLLGEIQTVVGIELTGSAAHLNCFPLTPEPFTQDNGAPVWNADPRISAITLRGWGGEREDRWVQVNHPDLAFLFNDRNGDNAADGGFMHVEKFVDGMESENGDRNDVLAESPWRIVKPPGALASKVEYIRPFIWRQLLNQGFRIAPLAVADAHTVYGNGVGGWRMYLPSKTDKPAEIDWTGDLSRHAKAGHIVLTTGPFLQVSTADGKLPGDEIKVNGGAELHVRVQCTDWLDIDRVQVLVNSRPEPSLNFTRKSHPRMFQDGVVKFDQKINVPLKTDAHLIVVAMHESMTLGTGYGTSSQGRMRPMAYHTPIYVDNGGDGFKSNGDTLGFEIPVTKMTADHVREKLGLPKESGAKESGATTSPRK